MELTAFRLGAPRRFGDELRLTNLFGIADQDEILTAGILQERFRDPVRNLFLFLVLEFQNPVPPCSFSLETAILQERCREKQLYIYFIFDAYVT